jgi:hypothetical protein
MTSMRLLMIIALAAGCHRVATTPQFRSYKEGETTRAQIRKDLGEPRRTVMSGTQDCDVYGGQTEADTYCYDAAGVLATKSAVR